MQHTDYESWQERLRVATSNAEPLTLPPRPTGRIGGMPVNEAYSGVDIVAWYGNIERQLIGMEQEYQNLDNQEYADRIHTFLLTWRNNPIDGSMNVEVLEVLEASAAQNAVDSWKLSNYFSNLRDQLRKLIAAQEELPVGGQPAQPAGRRKASRPPADFGPTAAGPAGEAPPAEGEAPPLPV